MATMPPSRDEAPTGHATAVPVEDTQYGPIEPSEEYVQQLRALVEPDYILQKSGYTLRQFTGPELNKKRRCHRCCRALPTRSRKFEGLPKAPAAASSTSKPVLICKFHPGRVVQKKWTCCNGHIFSQPCEGEEDHAPRTYANGELAREWRFYTTPPSQPNVAPAIAVVIDCEMGVAVSGESELIRVSAVDYFSRAVLLDSLVWPDVRMAHYNTRFSGVTRWAMEDARRSQVCIFGRANARKVLWKFIGPETIVIGHAGHQDLTSLRWIHPNVVDTLIIETRKRAPRDKEEKKDDDQEKESEKADTADSEPQTGEAGESGREGGGKKPKEGGGLSLRALAQQHLNRAIQVKGRGHDSLEDSIATRDILHWNITKLMEEKAAQSEMAMGWN